MSFLLAILPQDRDISPVFDCLRKFDIKYQVESSFEGLAPFAESYASVLKLNAEVKEEVDSSPAPTDNGHAVPDEIFEKLLAKRKIDHRAFNAHECLSNETTVKEEVEDVEKKEESLTDLPFVWRENSIPPEVFGRNTKDEGNTMGENSDATQWNVLDGGATGGDEEGMEMDQMEDQYDTMNQDSDEKGCPVDGCTEKFTTSEDLVEHMKKHPAPLLCGVCKRLWFRRADLRRHYKTHTEEKPFKCGICKKSFTEEGTLRTHQLTHSGERPYACHFCSKRFGQSGTLTRHMRIHSGERPFECDECDYKSNCCANLRKHKRKHTGEKPYSCATCGFKTAHSRTLTRHKKKLSH